MHAHNILISAYGAKAIARGNKEGSHFLPKLHNLYRDVSTLSRDEVTWPSP